MGAVFYRVIADMRRRPAALIVPVLLVGFVFAMILSLAGGARRTSTAPDRYGRALGGDADGVLYQFSGRPRTDEIRRLAGVHEVKSFVFVYANLAAFSVDDVAVDTFAGATPLSDRLIAGRLLDVAKPGEVMIDEKLVRLLGAKLGDHFPVTSFSREQVEAGRFAAPPEGPAFEVELVGVTSGPNSLDDGSAMVMFSPAILDQDIGISGALHAFWLDAGTSIDTFKRELASLGGGGTFDLQSGQFVGGSVRRAVHDQATALWIVTAVAAFAGVVALGQLLSRTYRITPDERRALSGLGFTRIQGALERGVQAAVPTSIGLLLAVAAAVIASQWFPIGFARASEPHPGVRVDTPVLAFGGVTLLIAALGWVILSSWFNHPPTTVRPAATTDALVSRLRSAEALAGARFAIARNAGRGSSVSSRLVGFAAAVAGVAAAITFAMSLDRLVQDGARYGSNYELQIGNGYSDAPQGVLDKLADDPSIEAMMLLGSVEGRVGDTTLQVVAYQSVSGGLLPRVQRGRLPSTDDEIALGALAAERLGVNVGDTLALSTGDLTTSLRVVGSVVVPNVGVNEGVGQGGLMTLQAVMEIDPAAAPSIAAVNVHGDADATLRARLADSSGTLVSPARVPAAIKNLDRISAMPWLLVALLASLALVMFSSAIRASLAASRRDLASLQSIGATRRFVGRVQRWQAAWLALAPVCIGLLIGVLLGRLVFRVFADQVGAVSDAIVPALVVALLAVALFGAAMLLAVISARELRRRPLIEVLRSA